MNHNFKKLTLVALVSLQSAFMLASGALSSSDNMSADQELAKAIVVVQDYGKSPRQLNGASKPSSDEYREAFQFIKDYTYIA